MGRLEAVVLVGVKEVLFFGRARGSEGVGLLFLRARRMVDEERKRGCW